MAVPSQRARREKPRLPLGRYVAIERRERVSAGHKKARAWGSLSFRFRFGRVQAGPEPFIVDGI
jgi:hypothetical protein